MASETDVALKAIIAEIRQRQRKFAAYLLSKLFLVHMLELLSLVIIEKEKKLKLEINQSG